MAETRCGIHDQLAVEAYKVLNKLGKLTAEQLEAFEAGEWERFTRLDRDLENTVGEKERAIGALREHDQEHGCQR